MTKPADNKPKRSAILLIYCDDRKGLVADITRFIAANDGNILHLDQHVDDQKQVFFMRIEWDLTHFAISDDTIGDQFERQIGSKYNMHFDLFFSDQVPRMALFVSGYAHCMYDILARHQLGEWDVEIPLIISNHADLEPVAKRFGIDYKMLPITKENKARQERRQLDLLNEYNIEFIVLARYMQILSGDFISHYPNRIINIHHSFLPAFPGAGPYHSAHNRGVKIIGATSHFVTEELDAGPIIDQDIVRVSHKDSVDDFIRKGRDLEKLVLSRAVWYYLERRLLTYDNRTVVFS